MPEIRKNLAKKLAYYLALQLYCTLKKQNPHED